jgi:DNA-binding NarL/FixJ family response regulator
MAKAAAVQEVIGAGPGRSTSYPGGLSLREIEVLTHLAQGRTNREIARDLVLSERTVQRHISNIYTKINVRNRAEATTFALNQLPS